MIYTHTHDLENYQYYSPLTGNSKQFLLRNSGPSAERILILGRPRNLNML